MRYGDVAKIYGIYRHRRKLLLGLGESIPTGGGFGIVNIPRIGHEVIVGQSHTGEAFASPFQGATSVHVSSLRALVTRLLEDPLAAAKACDEEPLRVLHEAVGRLATK